MCPGICRSFENFTLYIVTYDDTIMGPRLIKRHDNNLISTDDVYTYS